MKLNISDWESFCASDIFFLYNGSGITKNDYLSYLVKEGHIYEA